MLRITLLAAFMVGGLPAHAVPGDPAEPGGDRSDPWHDTLRDAPARHRDALSFLLEHMPASDRRTLDPARLVDEVALAYAARDAVPWGRDLPEGLFLNDVLPYANVSERRDPWRAMLMDRWLPLAKECATPAEAALRLNAEIFPALGVRYSTERARADQSPAESIAGGTASCTGLSILLVDACRAVCVPARLAGVPNWIDDRGNHTWVEIWSDGVWHFVGAAEPDAQGLDHAWFVADAAKARIDEPEHAIYAISYRNTGLEFPLRFDETAPPAWAVNVTARYARSDAQPDDRTRLLVTAVDEAGRRAAIAVTVRDPSNATATFTGITHAGTHDRNDRLTFPLPRGRRYEVSADVGAARAATSVTTAGPEVAVSFVVDTEAGTVRVLTE